MDIASVAEVDVFGEDGRKTELNDQFRYLVKIDIWSTWPLLSRKWIFANAQLAFIPRSFINPYFGVELYTFLFLALSACSSLSAYSVAVNLTIPIGLKVLRPVV